MWVRSEKKAEHVMFESHLERPRFLRAVRSGCTRRGPRRPVRTTRLLVGILMWRPLRKRLERKSTKHRSNIDENEADIDEKSTNNRSWANSGAQGCFGDASGRARNSFWTPKWRPKADLGRLRARREWPGAVQKRPWAVPETLQEALSEVSERLWCVKRRRACLQIDFSSFLRRRAEAPICVSHQF